MLLQDKAIVERLLHKNPCERIVITPLVNPKKQIGASSVDVRLGGGFRIPRRAVSASSTPISKKWFLLTQRPLTLGTEGSCTSIPESLYSLQLLNTSEFREIWHVGLKEEALGGALAS